MERDDYSVEATIKNLIEYDKRGRKLVEEAQRQRAEVLAHMTDYKREMVERYTTSLNKRVLKFTEQEQSETEEKLAQAQKSYETQLARMQRVYDDKHGGWADDMLARCIGG